MTRRLAGWLLLVVVVIVVGSAGLAIWLSHLDKSSPPAEANNPAQTLLQKADDRTCGLPSASSIAAVERVSIQSGGMVPDTVTVKVGQTVRWLNDDTQTHHLSAVTAPASQTCNGFDSGDLAQGQNFAFTFTKPGTWKYQDSVNPTITAQVVVTE